MDIQQQNNTLTRYLYNKTEVKHSLFIAILEHTIDEALFWGFELYYSGFEEDTFIFLQNIFTTLFQKTNPSLRKDISGRLALEKRTTQNLASLSEDERNMLLQEPFKKLSVEVFNIYDGGAKSDKYLWLTIGLIVLAIILALNTPAEWFESLGYGIKYGDIFVIIGIVGTLILVFLTFTLSRRIIKKRILPLIFRAIVPLQPSDKELDKIYTSHKITKSKLGQKWIYKSLKKELERHHRNTSSDKYKVTKGDYTQIGR